MSREIPWEQLFEAANAIRARAHVPYSKFPVGAAAFYEDGTIIPGANVENSSYGLSVCAERNAIARGVLEGKKGLLAVAVVVDTPEPCPPCGMCRQVMSEFAPPELPVRSRNLKGDEARYTLAELLPHAFTNRFL